MIYKYLLSKKYCLERSKYVRWMLALMLMTGCMGAQAQSWTMVNGDTVHIDGCSSGGGLIYDNGGVNGDYTNSFNGWVSITVPSGVGITLEGSYNTESGYDKISVWDGNTVSGTRLVDEVSGEGTIGPLTATTGRLTIRFHTDGSSTRSGFALEWGTTGWSNTCTSNITSLEVSNITTTTATLTWTSTANELKLDYGYGIQTVTGSSITLTGLNANTLYTVRLYAEGDETSPCCVARTSFRTACGAMAVPVVESFDDYGYGETVFPSCWTLITNIDGTAPSNVSANVYSTAPASLRMSTTTAGYYAIAIMPEVEGSTMNQLRMRLKLRAPYSNAKIEVGVCSGVEQYSHNFTAVDTITVGTANQWLEFVVAFDTYSGTGKRPALRMHGSLQPSANLTVYVDEVQVETCGVWHEALVRRNAREMWVQWDEYGDPRVDVEYGPRGFLAGSGTQVSDTASPMHLTGLEPGTDYEIRFYASCTPTPQYSNYRSLMLSTLEGPQNDLNLCESFESGGTIPAGWRRNTLYDNTPQTSTYYRHSGSRSLRMRPNRAVTQPTVVLPMVDTVAIGQLSVAFWAYADGYATGRVVVGVMEYPDEAASFEPVDTVHIASANTWRQHVVSLGDYTGAGKYIALRVYDDNTYYNTIYIDDLTVGTCLLSGALVTNIGSRAVELRWDTATAAYHGDSVVVEYGGTGFGPGEGTRMAVAVRGTGVQTTGGKQRLAIAGLEPDSAYEFRLYGQCDVQTQVCGVAVLAAHTLAADPGLPYCMDFEGVAHGTAPSGWTRTTIYSSEPCVMTDRPTHSGSGTLSLYANGDLGRGHSTIALPMLDVDSLQGLTLSFHTYSNYNGTRHLQIGVMDDPADEGTFVPVIDMMPAYNQYGSYVYTIENYSGTGRYLALRWWFEGCNGCNYLCYVDDLIVGDAATLERKVTSVTSHGATLSWEGTGRAYSGAYVEWDTAGFVRGTGHTDTVDANTFRLILDTLQTGVAYDAYITALSSESDVTCNYDRHHFTTFAQPTAASYCYGFEDLNNDGFPTGWTRPETYSNTPRARDWTRHNGDRSLYFYSYNCSTPYQARAVMPYLEEEDLTDLTLRFWAYGNGAQTHLSVGMTDDPNSSGAFDTLATFPIDHWGSWQEYSVDLSAYSGTGRHIVFRWATANSCNSGELFIDDITINRCRVSNVRAYSETTTTVTIDWQTEGSPDSVEVEYGPTGFAPGTGTFIRTTGTTITLTGLTPNTGYDYYVRPYCPGSTQVCSESRYTFTTTPWRVGDGWCCDFESNDGNNSMPRWWRRATGQDGWPMIWIHSDSRYYTSANAAFEFRAYNGNSNLAVLPASEDPLGGLVLSFQMRLNPVHSNPERCTLVVGVMPNPYDIDSFVGIDTLHPDYLYRRYDVSLASYTGPWRHLALKYLDSESRITYIDDLALTSCRPTQERPVAVADSSIGLRWQRLGYSDATLIQWQVAGGEWRTDTVHGTDTTFTGLYPDTTYHFRLYSSCSDTTQPCLASSLTVRTLAEPMAAPLCIDFEGLPLTDGLPAGWVRPYGNTESGVDPFGSNHTTLGSAGMRLYASHCGDILNDRTSMVIMPALVAESLGGLWLEMHSFHENPALALEVGLMSDPYDSTTFSPIDTLWGVPLWTHHLVELGRYSGSGRHIAFRSQATGCSSGNVHLDDISIRSCALGATVAGQPTESSLTVSVQPMPGATGACIEYHAIGNPLLDFQPGSGDTVWLSFDTAFSTTIDGLLGATWYAFHVYPVCGADGAQPLGCNPLVARAQTQHPGVDVPYCENFDALAAGGFPDNWRRTSTYGDNEPQTSTNTSHSESQSLRFQASEGSHTLAVMPRLYVGAACPAQVDSLFANFWIRFTSGWDHAALVVGVVSDASDAATFVAVDTVRPTAYNIWEHRTVTLRHFASRDSYVAYKFISTNDGYAEAYLDDLCMEKCVASDVVVSEITQNSATVTWTSYGVDSLVCEYGPRGFAAGSGTTVVLRSSPALIEGLEDGTEYEFTFGSVCSCESYGPAYPSGGGSSGIGGGWGYSGWGWVPCYDSILQRLTHCWRWGWWHGHPWSYHPPVPYPVAPPYIDTVVTQAAYLAVPYCEGFEDYDTIGWPPSWRRIGGQAHGYPTITRKNKHTGSQCVNFYAPAGSSNHAALAPLEPGTVNEMVLTFYAYSTSSYATGSSARFEVGVMTDPDNAATFQPVDTVRLSATGVWEQHVTDLAAYSGSGQYIAFRFAPVGGSYHLYIDDIYLGRCAISGQRLTSTPTDVTLQWTAHHTPTQVLVEYGLQGFTPGDTSSLGTFSFTASPATLTGIDPNANYDFYTTAICTDTAAGCFTSPLTLNPKLYTPYCEDFESLPNDVVPTTWKVVRRNAYRPQYPLTETQHGQQVIAFFPGSGTNDNVVLLPPLPDGDTLEGKWIHAQFSASSTNYIYLDFGFLTDTANASTFVGMGTMAAGVSDQLREFDLQLHSDLAADRRLAIRARSTSGERWLRLAQLVVSGHPYPTGITDTPLGVARRRVSWSGQHGNSHYTLEYGFGNQWQQVASDSCSATLTGLLPGQTYEVYFISPTGERLCQPYTFTTPDYLDLPHCDNFESHNQYALPDQWASAVSWTSTYAYPRVERNVHYTDGLQALQLYNGCRSNRWNQATMPDIGIDSLRHATLRFMMRTDYSGTGNLLIIGVQTEQHNPATFTPVDTLVGHTDWRRHLVNLAPYQGDGRYITFRHQQTDGNCHYAYIDQLEISSCPLPTLTVTGAHQVSAVTAASDAETDYWLEYGIAPFVQGQQDTVWNTDSTAFTLQPHSTLVHVTQSSYTITGLQPATSYAFYTRCAQADSTCAAPTILTTTDRFDLPFCEDFDSYADVQALPGWYSYCSYPNDIPSYPRTYYSAYNSCCRTLDFYCNRDNLQYIALPDLAVDSLRHLELYFSLRIERTDLTRLIIGVMDDRTDYATFTPIDTLSTTANGQYFPCHVSLSNYQGHGRFVAFRILTTYSSRTSLFIDDLHINTIPTPDVTLSSATTLTITRQPASNPAPLWIEYGPAPLQPGADSNHWVLMTADTLTVSGLQPLTTYHVYHHADSGGTTCFEPQTVTTSILLPMPYCDGFGAYDNGTLPPGWTAYNTHRNDYPYRNSNGHIQFYTGCSSGSRCYAVMPDMQIDSVQQAELYFNLYSENTNLFLIVGVLTDKSDIGSFIAVDTLRPGISGYWRSMHTSLDRYRGNGRFVAFCFVNPNGNCASMYIDDLYIQTCPRPGITLAGGTTVRAVVDARHAADYWIEYGPQGIVPGQTDTLYNDDNTSYTLSPHNTLLHITSDTFLITNLQPNTTYDFYARCDSAAADCYPLSARITTSMLTSVPYCEEFAGLGTGYNAFPVGWRRFSDYNDNYRPYISNDASGYYSLRFYNYQSNYAAAVMPDLLVDDISSLYLRLHLQSNNHSYCFLEVGVMTNPDDMGTFLPLDTLRNSASYTWEMLTTSLARYTGDGRFIAFRQRSTSGWQSIYLDLLEVLTCDIPGDVSAILHSHNQVRIDASRSSATGFWVEYGPQGFEQGTGTFVHVEQLPHLLTLAGETTYDFYFRCDTIPPTCLPVQSVTTLAPPVELPLCETFDSYGNAALPTHWQRLNMDNNAHIETTTSEHHSGTSTLGFWSYNQREIYAVLPDLEADSLQQVTLSYWLKGDPRATITVGVMSDPSDPSSFMPLRASTCTNDWTRILVSFAQAPSDGRFIALRYSSTYYYYPHAYVDDLHVTTCGATDMRMQAVESDHVIFDWLQTGQPQITIEYGPTGFARGTGQSVAVTTAPPYTLTGLDNLTNYQFYFDAQCDDGSSYCSTNYSDSITLFTPSGGTGCIDPTNLTADYTTCFYGSYSNPYQYTGTVDYGSASVNSRHSVHFDPSELDPRTGNLLRTVPEGSQASVRLGNWGTGAEAEAVTYSLAIDTTQFDLLLLKYAAVLQDNDHPSSAQPRFKMELLDTAGVLLDTCSAADFIANQALGWHLVPESYVLWKDWTTVGVDVGRYHGQTVRVRLTVYDCQNGDHYGYAYFTLSCMTKALVTSHCGEVAENSFSAPTGFSYNWYSNQDTTVFSTDRTIVVPTDNDITYYCRLAFVDNPGCNFTMSAFAGTRFPLALLDTAIRIEDCRFYVDLTNRSTISMDGTTPIGTGEGVESVAWDFGNGTGSTQQNPGTVVYDSAGTYTLTLVASIAGGGCQDTAQHEITLTLPPTTAPTLAGATDRCAGGAADTLRLAHAADSSWAAAGWLPTQEEGAWMLAVSPAEDTTYRLTVRDSLGCEHRLTHSVAVHPVYDLQEEGALCEGGTYAFGDTVLADTGRYELRQQTAVYGCDSLTHLHLTAVATTFTTLRDTVVENELPYLWEGIAFDAEGDSTLTLRGAAGCDSVVTLSLMVFANMDTTLRDTVCESALPYEWHGLTFDAAGIQHDTLQAANGADSVVAMMLSVVATQRDTVHEYVTQNDLPHSWGGLTLTGDTTGAEVTLLSAAGCDSVVHYSLTVHWNADTTLHDTVCASELPVTWNGHIFNTAGTQTDTLKTAGGADSVVRMSLVVMPVYYDTVVSSICDNQNYQFGDTICTTAGVYTQRLVTLAGCDSVRTLQLAVRSTTMGDTMASECDTFTWYGTTYTESGTATRLLRNAASCDSLLTLHLTVRHSTSGSTFDTVVENALPHSYGGISFASDTTGATVTLVNAAGCDSVVSYTLTVHRNVDSTLYDTLCASALPTTWNGVTIGAASSSGDTTLQRSVVLANRWGADSTVTLQLTVHPLYDGHTMADICMGGSYTFGDSLFTGEAGSTIHTDSLSSRYGCDSLSTLHLTVYPTYSATEYDTVCNQTGYSWGSPLRQVLAPWSRPDEGGAPHDTVVVDSLSTTAGCDSVRTLQLTVLPAYDLHYADTICGSEWDAAGGSWIQQNMQWEGGTYDSTGSYTITYQTAAGCDSLRTLHLTVHAARAVTVEDTVFDGDRYPFEGRLFTTDTDFDTLLTSTAGCDSLRTLRLKVLPRTPDDSTVCENALPVVWNGITFAADGTYASDGTRRSNGVRQTDRMLLTDSVRLVGRGGLDSLVVMQLVAVDTAATTLPIVACDSLVWQDGNTYRQSTQQPTLRLTGAAGCDSVLHLDLTIHPTVYSVDRQTGCDSLTWIDGRRYLRDTTATVGPLGSGLSTGPVDTLQTAAGCDSVVSLELTMHYATFEVAVDTFCWNQPYTWRGQQVAAATADEERRTDDMRLTDTLQTAWGCDSVLAIDLTRMGRIATRIAYTIDCQRERYLLHGEAEGDHDGEVYMRWSSYPDDPQLADSAMEHDVVVAPQGSTTTYYLYADYHEAPLCPVSDSVRLKPIVIPEAEMKVTPEAMSFDNLSFDAYDLTRVSPSSLRPDTAQVWNRQWIVDGAPQIEPSAHLHWAVPMADVDSVVVELAVYNGQCADTALHVVPLQKIFITSPNIFTPQQETNKVFRLVTRGVVEGELLIYNREGLLVYRTTDYSAGWDGRDRNGRFCPQGNYVWKLHYRAIDYPDTWRTEVGSVILLK